MKTALYILSYFFLASYITGDNKARPYDVYIFLHDECIISQYYTIPLAELHEEYHDIANFIGVFPNPQMTPVRLKKFGDQFNLTFKLKADPDFELVQKLNATITPEVMVIENRSGNIVYTGRIDNAYARVGKKRTIVTTHELQEVLTSLRKGETVMTSSKPAIGCIITQVKTK